MLRYILKRILLMIPVLLGIVVIVFTLMYVLSLIHISLWKAGGGLFLVCKKRLSL